MGGYTLIYPLNDEILSNEFKIEEYRILTEGAQDQLDYFNTGRKRGQEKKLFYNQREPDRRSKY